MKNLEAAKAEGGLSDAKVCQRVAARSNEVASALI
jgi:hypothetical protein